MRVALREIYATEITAATRSAGAARLVGARTAGAVTGLWRTLRTGSRRPGSA